MELIVENQTRQDHIEAMAIKYIRDMSIGLGAISMLTVPWFEALDVSKDDDPRTDVTVITIASSATGAQIEMQDANLGYEIVVPQLEPGTRVTFYLTGPINGSNV